MSDQPQTTALDGETERNLDEVMKGLPTAPARPLRETLGAYAQQPASVASMLKGTAATLESIDRDIVELSAEFARRLEAIRKRLGAVR